MARGITPPKGSASKAPATPPPFRGTSSAGPRTVEAVRRRETWNAASAEGRSGAQKYAEKRDARLSDADRVVKINLDDGFGASSMRKAFDILGVARDCTVDALDKAKREMMRRFHPDANNSSLASESTDVQKKVGKAFQHVQDAYSKIIQHREEQTQLDRERDEAERKRRERAAEAAERERKRQEALNKLKEEERRRRLEELRRKSAEVKANLQQLMTGHPLTINTEALRRAIKEADIWLYDVNLLEQAHSALVRAEQQQQQVSCEMAGGADLKSGVVSGLASKVSDGSDEFFAVGVFPCRCQHRHFWAMESSGQTGAEPFGKHALVCTAIGAPRKEDEQARHMAEARYTAVTGLALIESTGPPASRPGQWSSIGMGLLKMKGWEDEGPVMWQFERKDSADGYGPGWHNYQPDPKTGVDSVKIVEQLYQQHRHWGGGQTGTRSVASGRFSYSLNFVAGADGVQRHGEQTNTQTSVKRAVRRVPAAQACTCQACTKPRLATTELKEHNAALLAKLESGQATPREKEKLKAVQDALEKQQAEDKAIASGLATAELMKRSSALMGKLESGQATPRDKEKLQTVMNSIEHQQAEDKVIPGLATAELKERGSALMGKLESGQATPRDKQKLQAVQDALQKQQAEDKSIPGTQSRPGSAPARATVPPPPVESALLPSQADQLLKELEQKRTELQARLDSLARALRPDAPPQGGGGDFEKSLKALLVPGENGLPRCWSGQTDLLVTVTSGSPEFDQVKGHLLHSLHAGGSVQVGKILRVQNAAVYKATHRDAGSENLMFHGCKSTENESSIVQGGFSVAKCVSGGPGHGTWFAYNSSYSDGNFAFNDAMGWRHLFVCIVSKHGLKRDDTTTMRVVGQGGAYPQWIVHYRHGP